MRAWLNELLATGVIALVSHGLIPPWLIEYWPYALGGLFVCVGIFIYYFQRKALAKANIELAAATAERDRAKNERDVAAVELAKAKQDLGDMQNEAPKEAGCAIGDRCLLSRSLEMLRRTTAFSPEHYKEMEEEIRYFASRLHAVQPLTVRAYRIRADWLRKEAVSSKHVLYATADSILEYYAIKSNKGWVDSEDEATRSKRQRIIIVKTDAQGDLDYSREIVRIFKKLSKSSDCRIIIDYALIKNSYSFLLRDSGVYRNNKGGLAVTLSFSAFDYSNIFSHNPGGHFALSGKVAEQELGPRLIDQFDRVWNAPELADDFRDTQAFYSSPGSVNLPSN